MSEAHKDAERVAPEIYVWFAESKSSLARGERFIRAWTDNPARVETLRKAIGRDPITYRAASPQAPAVDGAEAVAWLFHDTRLDAPGKGQLGFDAPNPAQLALAEKYGWKWIALVEKSAAPLTRVAATVPLTDETVARLKHLLRRLDLENAVPPEILSDPEALFSIFGQMRSKLDRLTAKRDSWPLPCDRPPAGWVCSRGKGHDGPCAASPAAESKTLPRESEGES